VAEEVEKVNPNLIVRDREGKPYSVRYDTVNAMLLNEFLKEHKKVEEQEAMIAKLKAAAAEQDARATKQEAAIAQQQKQVEALVAMVKEQVAKIQKVNAQVELSEFATVGIRGGGPAAQVVVTR
jgi:hypothetical protein